MWWKCWQPHSLTICVIRHANPIMPLLQGCLLIEWQVHCVYAWFEELKQRNLKWLKSITPWKHLNCKSLKHITIFFPQYHEGDVLTGLQWLFTKKTYNWPLPHTHSLCQWTLVSFLIAFNPVSGMRTIPTHNWFWASSYLPVEVCKLRFQGRLKGKWGSGGWVGYSRNEGLWFKCQSLVFRRCVIGQDT